MNHIPHLAACAAMSLLAAGLPAAEDLIAKFDPNLAIEKAVVTNGMRWIYGRCLPIEGRVFDDVDRYYD